MPGSAVAVTAPFSNGTGGTPDGNGSNWSPSKTPSYTKSVSWQHHPVSVLIIYYSPPLTLNHFCAPTFILIKNNEVSFVIFLVIDCVIGVRMI